MADVLIQPGLREFDDDAPRQLAALYAAGHTSVKIQMQRPSFDQRGMDFLNLIRSAGEAGAITLIHCEDHPIVTDTTDALMAAGKTSARYWGESRPVLAELISVQRAIALSEHTEAPVYIVHLPSVRPRHIASTSLAVRSGGEAM